MASISRFITQIGQGVKPNMFSVQIPFPTGIGPGNQGDELANLLCKSAALPGSSLGVIEVPFRGRTIKIAGDRTFDTWSATFFNDKNMNTRGWFESWLNAMNNHNLNGADLPNLGTTGGTGSYSVDIIVNQLERAQEQDDTTPNTNKQIIRGYNLKYAFPTSVSQIDLAYDSNDQIEEFTVEFQYSYWTATASRGGAKGIAESGAQI
jgi:hypothetical protein